MRVCSRGSTRQALALRLTDIHMPARPHSLCIDAVSIVTASEMYKITMCINVKDDQRYLTAVKLFKSFELATWTIRVLHAAIKIGLPYLIDVPIQENPLLCILRNGKFCKCVHGGAKCHLYVPSDRRANLDTDLPMSVVDTVRFIQLSNDVIDVKETFAGFVSNVIDRITERYLTHVKNMLRQEPNQHKNVRYWILASERIFAHKRMKASFRTNSSIVDRMLQYIAADVSPLSISDDEKYRRLSLLYGNFVQYINLILEPGCLRLDNCAVQWGLPEIDEFATDGDWGLFNNALAAIQCI